MSKKSRVHNITTLSPKHEKAATIGKIVGYTALPLGLMAGGLFVAHKTKEAIDSHN